MIAALYARFIAPFWLPILAGIAAAALIGFAVQTTRIEGLKILFFEVVGFKQEVATLKLDLDKIKAAQIVAGERAAAAKAETERQLRDAAERAEHDHAIELDRARSATAAFIARNRVRAKAIGGASSGTDQAGQDQGAAVPSDASDTALVAVSERDVEIAAENYVYAKKAHDLFQDLIAKGLAEPGK